MKQFFLVLILLFATQGSGFVKALARSPNPLRMANLLIDGYSSIGTRKSNEDRIGVDRKTGLCFVADGFGGQEVARLIEFYLPKLYSQSLAQENFSRKKALAKALKSLQKLAHESPFIPDHTGATLAVLALPCDKSCNTIVAANLGDSVSFCFDQDNDNFEFLPPQIFEGDELQEKIESLGGTILEDPEGKKRLFGVLEPAGAIGCRVYQQFLQKEFSFGEKRIIDGCIFGVGSDGFFENFRANPQFYLENSNSAESLCETVHQNYSDHIHEQDNTSCIIVTLNPD